MDLVLADETDDAHRVVTTVLELAGQDQPGLLADVTHLLTTNGCDVRSAAVRGSFLPGPECLHLFEACIKLVHMDAMACLYCASDQRCVCLCVCPCSQEHSFLACIGLDLQESGSICAECD